MKLLHLDSGREWRGGQMQLLLLATGLARRNVEQKIVLREGSVVAARFPEGEFQVSALPFRSELDLPSAWRLRDIIHQFEPDIIHAHDARTLGLLVIAKLMRIKAKVVVARRVSFALKNNLFTWFKYHKAPSRIIAVSQFARKILLANGIASEMVDVVYDGIDWTEMTPRLSRCEARQRLGLADDAFVIGCAGRFAEEKGHSVLIRGFRQVNDSFPRARLVLAGDGELKAKYLEMVREAGLEGKVSFPGFVPDLETIWPALDLFVFPSLHEGLGSSLLLAMAHGVPVCASRTGGIPEIVTDGKTGRLFTAGDPAALADAVRRAMTDPQQLRIQAEAGRREVRERFSTKRMVEETFQIYTNVLGC